MAAPRFLIAKYAPDLHRMEPKNIGLILWANGGIAARFVGEIPGSPDDIQPPSFVSSRNRQGYAQWVQFWRGILARREITSRTHPDPVPQSEPEYLDAFLGTARENYLLVDGGRLLDAVTLESMQDVCDHLFAELIAIPKAEMSEHERFKVESGWRHILERTGLHQDTRMHRSRRRTVECTYHHVTRHLAFEYVYDGDSGNGNVPPQAVFERVLLSRSTSVNNASMMFLSVVDSDVLTAGQCGALVHRPPAAEQDEATAASLEFLATFGKVIDVGDQDEAVAALQQMNLPVNGSG